MKSLVFGIVGAAVAAFAWKAVDHMFDPEFTWLALGVGLVTGIAVRKGADANSGESFGRGAMAAIIALAACVGAYFGYVEFMKAENEKQAKAAADKIAEVDKAEEPAEDPNADPNAAAEEVNQDPVDISEVVDRKAPEGAVAEMKVSKPSVPNEMDEILNLLWLSGSGLIAYIFGKGGKAAVAQAGEAAPPAESEGADESESKEGDA